MLNLFIQADGGASYVDLIHDLGILPKRFNFGKATAKINKISVPYRNGDLYTKISQHVFYNNRTMQFPMIIVADDPESVYDQFMTYIHGKKGRIWTNTDPNYYYEGIFDVGALATNQSRWQFTLQVDAYPYKIRQVEKVITRTATEWNADVTVSGMPVEITVKKSSSASATVTFDGTTKTWDRGDYTIPIKFHEGTHRITLKSSQQMTFTISYREGKL